VERKGKEWKLKVVEDRVVDFVCGCGMSSIEYDAGQGEP
jgi:hypothetical protein